MAEVKKEVVVRNATLPEAPCLVRVAKGKEGYYDLQMMGEGKVFKLKNARKEFAGVDDASIRGFGWMEMVECPLGKPVAGAKPAAAPAAPPVASADGDGPAAAAPQGGSGSQKQI